jgi:hypothetical protein
MTTSPKAAKGRAGRKASSPNVVTEPANYVPPPRLLASIIRKTTDALGNPIVELPAEAFAKLLESALSAGFNEASYLARHHDIDAGVAAGAIPSGLRHFASHGFLEGRAPLNCAVDAEWYLRTYPDVETAVKAGDVTDAADHFELFGYAEGRVPAPVFQQTVADWQRLAANAERDSRAATRRKNKP